MKEYQEDHLDSR